MIENLNKQLEESVKIPIIRDVKIIIGPTTQIRNVSFENCIIDETKSVNSYAMDCLFHRCEFKGIWRDR